MNLLRSLRAVRDRFSSNGAPRNSSPVIESLESRVMLDAWTVLVYMDGDNNLEGAAIDDINEMERVGSVYGSVNIVVQCDRIDGYDTTNGNWTDTRRALIQKDTSTTQIGSAFTSIGEVNMGDQQSLLDFLLWGVDEYTADHYAVILWDHGGGIDGVCWDATSGNDYLELDELDWAFGQAESITGANFDVIGFDACLMGMVEVAYEVSDYGDFMVASEYNEPGDGWAYDQFLYTLVHDPGMSAGELTEEIVSTYVDSYASAVTLSSIDLYQLTKPNTGLTAELDNFVINTLIHATTSDYTRIQDHWNNTIWFDSAGEFSDLGMFLELVADDDNLTSDIQNSARDALAAYNQSVWCSEATVEGPTGMSIYFPDTGPSSAYLGSGFDFVDDGLWDVFLDWFEDGNASGYPGQVRGYIFDDVDCDGVEDAGETNLLDGWQVRLSGNGRSYTTYTNSAGFYLFNNVLPGEYTVNVVDNPSDGLWSTMTSGQSVTVAPAQTTQSPGLGAALAGEIRGTVYERDAGSDTPAGGWTVYIDANRNNVRDDGEQYYVTSADGTYHFVLLKPNFPDSLSYIVRVESKEGYRGEEPPEDMYTIRLDSDESSTGNDFVFQQWLYARSAQTSVQEDHLLQAVDEESGKLYGYDPLGLNFEFVLQDGPQFAGGVDGVFTFNADGTFTYQANKDYNGPDGFSFYCRSTEIPNYESDLAYVAITVTPVNDAPMVTETQINLAATEEVPLDLDLAQYFQDIEADIAYPPDGSRYLTYELDPTRLPQMGQLTIDIDDGLVTCTYFAGRVITSGTDVFAVRAVDFGDPHGSGDDVKKSEYLLVNIDVEAVNDDPVCKDQYKTVRYNGGPIEFFLLGTDEETNLRYLDYTVSEPVYQSNGKQAGRLDMNSNRATYYFPEHRFRQDQHVQFTYSVTDPDGAVSEAVVYLTITPPEGTYVTVGSGYTARYWDEDGSLVNVRVNRGIVVLFFAGEDISSVLGRNRIYDIMGGRTRLCDLQIGKADLRTTVTVSARGGDGRATIGCIRGESVLGRFNGRSVDLVGHGVEMTGNGYIRNLNLHDVQYGADITMQGAGRGMTMSLGAIDTGTDIFLGYEDPGKDIVRYANLNSFRAVSWAGGSLTANSVGTFTITGRRNQAGNLNADVILKSPGRALNNVRIAGRVGGTWDIEGSVGNLFLGGSTDDWDFHAVGYVRQIRSGGALGGTLTVGQPVKSGGNGEKLLPIPGTSIGSIFAGSLNGATIRTGGGIGLLRVGNWQTGTLEANWIRTFRTGGALGADITLAGNWRGSSIHSAFVGGRILGGTWNLSGSLRTLSAMGGTADGWTVDVTGGGVGSLISRGNLGGTITTAGTFGLIKTTGTFTASVAVNGVNNRGVSVNRLDVGRSDAGRLTAVGGVGRVQAGEWLNGEIRAAYVDYLQTTGRRMSGDLSADITLTGKNRRGQAWGLIRVAGDWDGNIDYTTSPDAGAPGTFYEGGKRITV